ncbi:MAG: methyltransferase domain-containing protein [Ahrensia sp.]|nr:methyltransferase domain-containing protein [Ahrensia sp.]
MQVDIVEMRAFYHSALGQRAGDAIATALKRVWEPLPNERLLGLGYARPWLERFEPDTHITLSFMLAAQGAAKWPRIGPSRTALVFEEELPLADASIDRILAVHTLEHSENPRETLMELWRVLAPNGRLIVVVPNRSGVWARVETTPFGIGRPFSRGQISRLLREANFTVTKETEALFFPPSRRFLAVKLSNPIERAGLKIGRIFGGVIVLEAQKQLYQGLPVSARQSRRVFVPALSPQRATRTFGEIDSA